MFWAHAPHPRTGLVLFQTTLDDIIPEDHPVRLLDSILDKIDWSSWVAPYRSFKGMRPIHPRVMVSVLLYGLLKRVRTTRNLEDALTVRNDFRWLAEGRVIDHTTLAKFRTGNTDGLKRLFVQIGLIAREIGQLELQQLGYDGTRIRASNRRTGTRTPEELREAKKALEAQFAEHEEAINNAETKEDEAFDAAAQSDRKRKKKQVGDKLKAVEKALEVIEAIEEEGKQVPDRIPTTDPESRICPNKEGGFSPNHTPTVTTDIDSGMIVDTDVISGTDEQNHMHDAVDRVRENFGVEPEQTVELLADGLMVTGANVSQCDAKNIKFYSPPGKPNPAYRADPSQPLSAAKIAKLPLRGPEPKAGEEDTRTFDKSAFIYDQAQNVYWCPQGKKLTQYCETKDHRGDVRYGYRADKNVCAACPFKDKCFKNTRNQYGRRIECGEHEKALQSHAAEMRKPESKQIYKRRAAATERPFATIKHAFGIRAFLTRGLARVRDEWRWACCACNLLRLMNLTQAKHRGP